MERVRWTDDRLDERMAAIDHTFARIDASLADMRADMREVRVEMRDLRGDFAKLQDRLVQIGFGLVAVLAAQLVTALVALAVAVA